MAVLSRQPFRAVAGHQSKRWDWTRSSTNIWRNRFATKKPDPKGARKLLKEKRRATGRSGDRRRHNINIETGERRLVDDWRELRLCPAHAGGAATRTCSWTRLMNWQSCSVPRDCAPRTSGAKACVFRAPLTQAEGPSSALPPGAALKVLAPEVHAVSC